MDFANERYVRIYTRDTLTWKRMRFEGQTVFMHVARKLDRSGTLDLDDLEPAEAIFVITGVPMEFVEAGLAHLLRLDVFRVEDGRLYAPNWLAAQEAKATASARQQRYRDRQREGLAADGTAGTVYFVRSIDSGLIKIGVTSDVAQRIASFQTSVPGGVELVHTEAGGPVRERELHTVFHAERANGEWFRYSDSIAEYVTSYAATNRDSLKGVTGQGNGLRNARNDPASLVTPGSDAVTSRVTPSLAVPSLAKPSLAVLENAHAADHSSVPKHAPWDLNHTERLFSECRKAAGHGPFRRKPSDYDRLQAITDMAASEAADRDTSPEQVLRWIFAAWFAGKDKFAAECKWSLASLTDPGAWLAEHDRHAANPEARKPEDATKAKRDDLRQRIARCDDHEARDNLTAELRALQRQAGLA